MVGSHWERLGLGGRVEGGVKAKWSVHKLMLIRLSADGGQTGWEEHLLTTCSPSAHTSSPGGRGGVEVGGGGGGCSMGKGKANGSDGTLCLYVYELLIQ